MGRLRVVESLTLDGVMQAPGRADEDTRDGFEHGGWATPYVDEVMGRAMGEQMGQGGSIVLGLFVPLELADSLTTTIGVVIGTYRPVAAES
jgi:hypothetical protein